MMVSSTKNRAHGKIENRQDNDNSSILTFVALSAFLGHLTTSFIGKSVTIVKPESQSPKFQSQDKKDLG